MWTRHETGWDDEACPQNMLLLIVEVDVRFRRFEDRGLLVPSNKMRFVGGRTPMSQGMNRSLVGRSIRAVTIAIRTDSRRLAS